MVRSTNAEIEALADFLTSHRHLVVLTGAGISCGSGIPTYRDESGVWQRSDPIQHQAFMSSEATRQRYWIRSYAGWPVIDQARPGPAHDSLAVLERHGLISMIVTQNIDQLHQKAGSTSAIDLHGRLDEVICTNCETIYSRASIQDRLTALNSFLPAMVTDAALAPDGDAEVDNPGDIKVPVCGRCNGILKPNVVFFGGSVNRDLVEHVYNTIRQAKGLLIAGSSLQVFSGYRFVRFAADLGLPIISINPGQTRGDKFISQQFKCSADEILPAATALAVEA